MIYGSVCSGIEAASVAFCTKCATAKPRTAFYRQSRNKSGLHSWCKACWNAARDARGRTAYTPEQRSAANYRKRYGLQTEDVQQLLAEQGGVCGLCAEPPKRPTVDHDHITGKVRGILCHRCNLLIGGLDDPEILTKAIRWLERGR